MSRFYMIVTGDDASDLQAKVNNCMVGGFEPIGGVLCETSDEKPHRITVWAQAMIGPEVKPERPECFGQFSALMTPVRACSLCKCSGECKSAGKDVQHGNGPL